MDEQVCPLRHPQCKVGQCAIRRGRAGRARRRRPGKMEEYVVAGKPKTPGKRGRSAITGKFVKQSTVKAKPKTTVNESAKRTKKRKK